MIPGTWAAVIKLLFKIAHSQIYLISESHDNDLQLGMLLTECTAVVLSVRTFTCVTLILPHKLCKL